MTIALRDATREVSFHTWTFVSTEVAIASFPSPFFDKFRNIYVQELQVLIEIPPTPGNTSSIDIGNQDDPKAYVDSLEVATQASEGYTFFHYPLGGFIVYPGDRLHVQYDSSLPAVIFNNIKVCFEDYGNPPCWDGQ